MLNQQENLKKILKRVEQKEGLRIFSAEVIYNSLSKFWHMPDEGINFSAYFRSYETIFSKRCQSWSDEEKITLLLQKLGPQENTKYTNFILTKKLERVLL